MGCEGKGRSATPSRMKIAYIVTRLDELGGAQVHVRDLCLWMRDQGHIPVLLSGMPGSVSDDLQAKGIDYFEVPDMHRSIHPVKDFRAFLQIRRHLKQIKPDLVTCHSSKAGLVGRLAAWSVGLPVIFTAHNWTFGRGVAIWQRPIYWSLEWMAARFCNHIITVSDYGRQQALAGFIALPSKITAIHNGIISASQQRLKALRDTPRMTMVARVGWPKDHERLIRVLHEHCADLPWTLDLVGGGDLDFLQNIVHQRGLEDRVRILGERKDVEILLEESDIFALISDWEGFPLSILEAMAKGLPILASNVGGVSEAVSDGRNGLIVEAGSDLALADALKRLLPDRILRERMGEVGQALFDQEFRFDRMAAKTLALYTRVLTSGR